jgi:hypothetical protein
LIEGSNDGDKDGLKDGEKDGLKETLGCIETIGANEDGEPERALKVGEDEVKLGAEVGVREGGPELHVSRPDPAHAGYTQAGVEEKGPAPNVIPAQYSIIAIVSLLQP